MYVRTGVDAQAVLDAAEAAAVVLGRELPVGRLDDGLHLLQADLVLDLRSVWLCVSVGRCGWSASPHAPTGRPTHRTHAGTHLFPHVLQVAVPEVHRQALLDGVQRRVELLQALLRQGQAEVAWVRVWWEVD